MPEDRPAAQHGVTDDRAVSVAVRVGHRPAPVHAQPLGEVGGQVLPTTAPHLLHSAQVGTHVGQCRRDRVTALLPWSVTPPQIPRQNPHRPPRPPSGARRSTPPTSRAGPSVSPITARCTSTKSRYPEWKAANAAARQSPDSRRPR